MQQLLDPQAKMWGNAGTCLSHDYREVGTAWDARNIVLQLCSRRLSQPLREPGLQAVLSDSSNTPVMRPYWGFLRLSGTPTTPENKPQLRYAGPPTPIAIRRPALPNTLLTYGATPPPATSSQPARANPHASIACSRTWVRCRTGICTDRSLAWVKVISQVTSALAQRAMTLRQRSCAGNGLEAYTLNQRLRVLRSGQVAHGHSAIDGTLEAGTTPTAGGWRDRARTGEVLGMLPTGPNSFKVLRNAPIFENFRITSLIPF